MTTVMVNPKTRFYTTKAEVPLGSGQGVFFRAGRGYYAATAHPLHASIPKPKPPTDLQTATSQVSAAYDPVLRQLTDAANARGAAQQSAITGYTSELGKLMGGYGDVAQKAYRAATTGQAAIDAALAATREGQGAAAQAQLATKLAGIDPATAARVTGQFSSDLSGAAEAAAARGAAGLGSLLAQGASAQDYGAKLPGIAGGMGLRATQQAQGQITNDLNAQLGDLASKEPGAIQDALANLQGNRLKQAQIDFENALARKKFGLDVTKTNATITHEKNLDAPKPNPSLSKAYGYAVDQYGNPLNGKVTPLPGYHVGSGGNVVKDGKPAKPLSTSALHNLNGLAHDLYNGVAPHYHPVTVKAPDGSVVTRWEAVPGTGAPPVTWAQAVQRMVASGAPSAAYAIRLLEAQGWQPGEGGRPPTRKQVQAFNAAGDAVGTAVGGF